MKGKNLDLNPVSIMLYHCPTQGLYHDCSHLDLHLNHVKIYQTLQKQENELSEKICYSQKIQRKCLIDIDYTNLVLIKLYFYLPLVGNTDK